MEYSIITNNPTVNRKYENVIYIAGTVEDVLIRTRNLVQEGTNLITHPLPASIRMMFTPYRSIILSNIKDNMHNFQQLEIVEDSITKYREIIKYRNVDLKNNDDYENLDEWLLKSALNEINIIF